ncbi:MAG: hypothetical protein SWX82_00775 [Cyanobacteriota bacterium]|nr:hypothetical protein [Cyanobacteriota bacterium]
MSFQLSVISYQLSVIIPIPKSNAILQFYFNSQIFTKTGLTQRLYIQGTPMPFAPTDGV